MEICLKGLNLSPVLDFSICPQISLSHIFYLALVNSFPAFLVFPCVHRVGGRGKDWRMRDFSSGPVVKNYPFNVGDEDLISCWGTKILYAPGGN